MADQNTPQRLAVRTIGVTILALVVIQALQMIPIVGLRLEAGVGPYGLEPRFSIAAIAAVSWTKSAIAVSS